MMENRVEPRCRSSSCLVTYFASNSPLPVGYSGPRHAIRKLARQLVNLTRLTTKKKNEKKKKRKPFLLLSLVCWRTFLLISSVRDLGNDDLRQRSVGSTLTVGCRVRIATEGGWIWLQVGRLSYYPNGNESGTSGGERRRTSNRHDHLSWVEVDMHVNHDHGLIHRGVDGKGQKIRAGSWCSPEWDNTRDNRNRTYRHRLN